MTDSLNLSLPDQSLTINAQRIPGRGGCETASAPSQSEILNFMSVNGQACSLIPTRHDEGARRLQEAPDRSEPLEQAADISASRRDWSDDKIHAVLRDFEEICLQESHLPWSMRIALQTEHLVNAPPANHAEGRLPYFFYGASMFPSVLWALYRDSITSISSDRTAQSSESLSEFLRRFVPALLPMHCLCSIPHKSTPACIEMDPLDSEIQSQETATVGMLVRVEEDFLRDRIHTFQATGYQLKRVRVWVKEGKSVREAETLTYTWNKTSADLGKGQWSVANLLQDPWFLGIINHPRVQEAETTLDGR